MHVSVFFLVIQNVTPFNLILLCINLCMYSMYIFKICKESKLLNLKRLKTSKNVAVFSYPGGFKSQNITPIGGVERFPSSILPTL